MKPRFFPLSSPLRMSLILITVLVAACAPATSTAVPQPPVNVSPTQTPPLATATSKITLQATLPPTETLAPTPFPVVTSRGPRLEATDPKTVSMASGGLQLVEFFEFW